MVLPMSSDHPIVTATMMRDLVICERRPWLDVQGDVGRRAAVAPFVELLWQCGLVHEEAVLGALYGVVADRRGVPQGDRAAATLVALAGDADHVLGAELRQVDLLERPDLLSRHGGV
jgi:hypothetical protein